MRQKLQKISVIDSSSLIALERANLLGKLKYLDFKVIAPKVVSLEVGKTDQKAIRIENLKGRSIKKAKSLVSKGFGRGEAECLVLAQKLRTGYIVCDDRKLLRQKYMLEDKILKDIEIVGFSFIVHILFKKKQVNDIWKTFDGIIEKNNWKRSEVEAANFVFLKEMGY
ncbi:hypothetical protein HYW19_03575 [Candidatus Woesearchaeota archaeon]|nr:hypothetical protein [Candidatus Woesearchaeota archaeon]